MALIDRIKDGLGNIIHPITSTKAVYDTQGGRLDTIIASLDKRVLLWTNPSPTTAITNGFEIVIDMSQYDMIEVEYSQRTNNSIYGYEKGKVGKKMYLATTIGVVNQYRTLDMTLTSKIVCGDEANMNYANMTSTVDNTYMLPQRIWGIS